MWCLVVCQHDLHDQCPPQGKEKPLLEDPLSQSGKLLTSASTCTESHETNTTVQMNFSCPCIVTSERIELNDNDIELNAIAYAFSKTFQPETC